MTGTPDINSRTVGGLIAYCVWLGEKGYLGASSAKAWRIAVKKVFETVDGDAYEAVRLDGLDLDDHIRRFQVKSGGTYKAESITAYASRVRSAIEAQEHYLTHGRPPSFRKPAARSTKAQEQDRQPKTTQGAKPASPVAALPSPVTASAAVPEAEFFELNYPLSPDRMVTMRLPKRMSKREIDRLCQVIQTLEEQPQIPERSAA